MAASIGVLALVYMKIFLPESISMEETNALEIKLLDEESPTSEDSPSRNKNFFRGAPSFEDTLSLLKASKLFSQVAFVAFLNNVGDVGLHTSLMYYLKACFHFDKDDFANLMGMAGITGTVSHLALMPLLVPVVGEEKSLSVALFFNCAHMFLCSIAWSSWSPDHLIVGSVFWVGANSQCNLLLDDTTLVGKTLCKLVQRREGSILQPFKWFNSRELGTIELIAYSKSKWQQAFWKSVCCTWRKALAQSQLQSTLCYCLVEEAAKHSQNPENSCKSKRGSPLCIKEDPIFLRIYKGLFEDIKSLLMSKEDNESLSSPVKRHRKSFSDPEDVSDNLSNQGDSAGEDSHASSTANSRLLLDHYDDDLLNSRIISSKTIRRELRKQQRLAAERMCDICQHKMLPGKDVAALLNMKTGRLACSSRNVHGAFHVFHTSCLVHWILFCEAEMLANKPVEPNSIQRPIRRTRSKFNESVKQSAERKVCGKRSTIRKQREVQALHQQIRSVFCSDCQGTGIGGGGEELEKPTYHLSEACI